MSTLQKDPSEGDNVPYVDVWLCEDCTIAEANGDYSGMSDERADEVGAAFEALSAKDPAFTHLSANFGSDDDDSEEEGTLEFSSCQCEVCGTHLAGYRSRWAYWSKPNE